MLHPRTWSSRLLGAVSMHAWWQTDSPTNKGHRRKLCSKSALEFVLYSYKTRMTFWHWHNLYVLALKNVEARKSKKKEKKCIYHIGPESYLHHWDEVVTKDKCMLVKHKRNVPLHPPTKPYSLRRQTPENSRIVPNPSAFIYVPSHSHFYFINLTVVQFWPVASW